MPINVFTTIDDPSANIGTTQAFDINNLGQIVGQFSDPNGTHGFLLSGGTFFTLDDPSATGATITTRLTDISQIVGQHNDDAHNHRFLQGRTPNPTPPAATHG